MLSVSGAVPGAEGIDVVALFGLPGSGCFAWRWFATKAEGDAWLAARYRADESQATLAAYRESAVISDRKAAALRWPSGAPVLPRDRAEWAQHGAEQDAAEREERAYFDDLAR